MIDFVPESTIDFVEETPIDFQPAEGTLADFIQETPASPPSSPLTGSTPELPLEGPISLPSTEASPVPDDALVSAVRQEPPAKIPDIELPRAGEEGTVLRGATDVVAGLGEWGLNEPGQLVALAHPATSVALAARYLPGVVKQFGLDVAAAATGDKEALGRALAVAATIAVPAAAKKAIEARRIKEIEARRVIEPNPVTVDLQPPISAESVKVLVEEAPLTAAEVAKTIEPPKMEPTPTAAPAKQAVIKAEAPSHKWDKSGEIREAADGQFEWVENGKVLDTGTFDFLMGAWSSDNAGYSKRIVQVDPKKFELSLAEPLDIENPVHELIPLSRRQPIEQRLGSATKEEAPKVAKVEEPTVTAEVPKAEAEIIGMGGAVPGEFEPVSKTATGIKNATVERERAARGLPPAVEPARRSFGTVWDEAMALIDRDPATQDKLIAELRKEPRALTDLEDAQLLHRQIDLQNEYGKATRDLAQAFDDGRLADAEWHKARTAELHNQLFELYEINKKAGTETGRGLNARKMMANEDFTLAKMEVDMRVAKGGKPLTDAERIETNKTAEEFKQVKDKLEANQAEKDLHQAQVQVDETVTRIKAEKGSPENITKLTDQIKGAKEQAEVLPLAQKLAKAFVQSGITDRELLIDKVHEVLVDVFPDWTRRNTMDAISGYGQVKLLSKDEASVKLRDLKGQMQQIAKLEDMAKGQAPRKTGLERRTPSDVERQLIKQVNEAKKKGGFDVTDPATQLRSALESIKTRLTNQIADLEKEIATRERIVKTKNTVTLDAEAEALKARRDALKAEHEEIFGRKEMTDAQRLQAYKTRVSRQIEEIQRRLATNDFSKKTPKEITLDKAAFDLRHRLENIRKTWHAKLLDKKLAEQNAVQKVYRTGSEVLHMIRALRTSLDLSALLRQGKYIVVNHPIRGAKSVVPMLKALVSEKEAFRVMEEIQSRPNYPLYQRAKLYLSEPGTSLSKMEEAYMSRWSEKTPVVAASQRAYTTFLNKLRADSFDAMAASRGGHLSLVEAKIAANYINVATGRGTIGMAEQAAVGLNTVFFAPRYVASRFQMLLAQPLYYGAFSGKVPFRGTAKIRMMIAGEYARLLAGYAVIYGLASMAGFRIGTDRNSSDFGKIIIGQTRLDPLAGLSQVTVLLSRLTSGKKTTTSGKTAPIRGKVPYGGTTGADVIGTFLRTKLAPVPGVVVDAVTGKDVTGKPTTPEGLVAQLTVPISFGDILDTLKAQDLPMGVGLTLLSLLGESVQTYEKRPKP